MLHFPIGIQARFAHFPAQAALFHATEGGTDVGYVVDIDADATELQPLAGVKSGVQILGIEISGQAIGSAVGGVDRFLKSVETGDGGDRAEGLFLHDTHIGRDRAEHGGLQVKSIAGEACIPGAAATEEQGSAGGTSLVDVGLDVGDGTGVHQRAHISRRLGEAIAGHVELAGGGHEAVGEFFQ